jgi:undecaprenyl diphosphate synthase
LDNAFFDEFLPHFDELNNHPNLPKHIGIIMDGNGRWAQRNRLPRIAGHNEGVESVEAVVEGCAELGIATLTIYAFSEENWERPEWEISALMQLLVTTINRKIKRLSENNVVIRTIGQIEKLPEVTQKSVRGAVEKTRNNTGLILNIALSYGGRQEITTAVRKLALKVKEGIIDPEHINCQLISDHLDTSGQHDPDLIIRTSGEFRISNFMLWQIAYSEMYVTETPWPEFRKPHLYHAIWNYLNRERRFGKLREQIRTDSVFANA